MPVDNPQVILRNNWLAHHNPMIDWKEKEVHIKQDSNTHILRVNPARRVELISQKQAKVALATEDFELEKGDMVYLIQSRQDIEEELFENEPEETVNDDTQDPDVQKLLEEYQDIFQDEVTARPPSSSEIEHHIELTKGATPVQAYQYQMSPEHKATIIDTVSELLRLGHIKPSQSVRYMLGYMLYSSSYL